MSLLLLIRPSKSSAQALEVGDTHDGGDGWRKKYHFEILTQSEWKKLYQPGKEAQPIEAATEAPEPLEPLEPVTIINPEQSSELDEARGRYLYAAYRATALRENLDKLRGQIAIQEMLSFEKAQKAMNERALSIAIADLEKRYIAEERTRLKAMQVLEELDTEDFMLNMLLH